MTDGDVIRGPVTHVLKTWPEPFAAVCRGDKLHEIRVSDRDFRVGDTLDLREYDPSDGSFSGWRCFVKVAYVTTGGSWGLPPNLCVMSIVACQEPPRRKVSDG